MGIAGNTANMYGADRGTGSRQAVVDYIINAMIRSTERIGKKRVNWK